ncbi:MAG: hypothetical protein SNJ75_16440 [Gemmataceae bacterium]
MRAKNTGSFDHSTKSWRLRHKGVQISIRQLSKRYGVQIAPSERASAPYWRRFLQDMADGITTAPLMPLERSQMPPERQQRPQTITNIRTDADAFYAQHNAKRHKGKFQVRQALDVVLTATGDIPPEQVTVDHARRMHQFIEDNANWGQTTKSNIGRMVREFLNTVAAERNITTYGFLQNKRLLRWKRPKGRKVQYTLDDVKTALQHAEGEVRYALLCGLNFGAVAGDMRTITEDMVKGNHLIRSRQKLNHLDEPVVGSWLIWAETRQLLEGCRTARKLEAKYNEFAKQHGLPTHKALRKTTAQMITDVLKNELASRLFRGEATKGTHGSNYICDFTPLQVEQLDEALVKVGQLYGVNV